MSNILKDFWTRVKIDWIEWKAYRQSVWNVKRDRKAIERAIKRAKMKNANDGRTYYILKNVGGGFDEVNSIDLKNLRAKKVRYFPNYQDYNQMLRQCFAVITKNNVIRKSYVETIKSINNEQKEIS